LKLKTGGAKCPGDLATCTEAICCETDTTKCGTSFSCTAADKYYDAALRADQAQGATPQTACCLTKTDCTTFNCATRQKGLKLKTGGAKCPGAAATCTEAICCETDTTKCGTSFSCTGASTYFSATDKADTTQGATPQTACCQTKAKCNGFAGCVAGDGLTILANAATTDCPSNAASCTKELCCTESTCKELSPVTCIDGYEKDPAKDGKAATSANAKYVCCKPKAKCNAAGAPCVAPLTTKKNRCTVSDCKPEHCCKNDVEICKHSGTTACKDTNHYFDTVAKANTNWRTSASQDPTVACCTQKQTCAGYACNTKKKGLKLIATPANKKCAAACTDAECCETDTTKCGTSFTCTAADKYFSAAISGDTTQGATPQTACCSAKTDCTAFNCATRGKGLKLKTGGAKCPGDLATCTEAICCETDTTKCGTSFSCTAADKYYDAALRADQAQGATPQTACCLTKTDCTTFNCATRQKGLKLKTGGAKCPGAAATCTEAICCETDTTKCGTSFSCTGASTYFSATDKADTTQGATPQTACCQTKAKCNGFAGCVAGDGLTILANAATTDCPSNAASCTKELCCKEDTCKKVKSSVTCVKGWTMKDDTQDGKAVTAANKNYVCCKPEPAWEKCPAPDSGASGQSGGGGSGSSGGGGSGTVGSPSKAFEKFQVGISWIVALVMTLLLQS